MRVYDCPTLRFRILCGLCPGALGRLAGTLEFQVPDEVLGLIYAQTVVWVGSFFCPLLPLINTAKLLILFCLKKVRPRTILGSELTGVVDCTGLGKGECHQGGREGELDLRVLGPEKEESETLCLLGLNNRWPR